MQCFESEEKQDCDRYNCYFAKTSICTFSLISGWFPLEWNFFLFLFPTGVLLARGNAQVSPFCWRAEWASSSLTWLQHNHGTNWSWAIWVLSPRTKILLVQGWIEGLRIIRCSCALPSRWVPLEHYCSAFYFLLNLHGSHHFSSVNPPSFQ